MEDAFGYTAMETNAVDLFSPIYTVKLANLQKGFSHNGENPAKVLKRMRALKEGVPLKLLQEDYIARQIVHAILEAGNGYTRIKGKEGVVFTNMCVFPDVSSAELDDRLRTLKKGGLLESRHTGFYDGDLDLYSLTGETFYDPKAVTRIKDTEITGCYRFVPNYALRDALSGILGNGQRKYAFMEPGKN